MAEIFELRSPLWRSEGQAAWHFITLPRDVSAEIRAEFGALAAGFGSLRVEVKIGATTWHASIFPDSKAGSYLLPVKASVRRAEALEAGDEVRFVLRIR